MSCLTIHYAMGSSIFSNSSSIKSKVRFITRKKKFPHIAITKANTLIKVVMMANSYLPFFSNIIVPVTPPPETGIPNIFKNFRTVLTLFSLAFLRVFVEVADPSTDDGVAFFLTFFT